MNDDITEISYAGCTLLRREVSLLETGSAIVVTKSMARTPFGTKLVYKIDGECIWAEYLSRSSLKKTPDTISFCDKSEGVIGHLKRGVRTMLFLKAS